MSYKRVLPPTDSEYEKLQADNTAALLDALKLLKEHAIDLSKRNGFTGRGVVFDTVNKAIAQAEGK